MKIKYLFLKAAMVLFAIVAQSATSHAAATIYVSNAGNFTIPQFDEAGNWTHFTVC